MFSRLDISQDVGSLLNASNPVLDSAGNSCSQAVYVGSKVRTRNESRI